MVVGPARRRRGVGLVVVLAERRRVVGGGVDVGLLQRRLVEVGPLVGQQVVFVQRLRRGNNGTVSKEGRRIVAVPLLSSGWIVDWIFSGSD